jgi:hypothetical protein
VIFLAIILLIGILAWTVSVGTCLLLVCLAVGGES